MCADADPYLTQDAELDALLCLALDSADETRVAFVLRLMLSRQDAADLDAMRKDGPPPVYLS